MSTPFVGMIAARRGGGPAEALSTPVASLPGVARCRARGLPRRGQRLEAGLRLRLEPDRPPDAVLAGLSALTAEAEQAAAPYTAHTGVRLSAVSHRIPRVR